MERDYEKFISQVEECNHLFEEEVKKTADEATKIMADWRLSEQGKQEQKEKQFAALNDTANKLTTVFKTVVKRFCDDFRVILPEDEKDHGKDIENALKIIDMLGMELDEKNLENIMNPLRGSFRSMKMIVDLIEAKNKTGLAGAQYSPKVMEALYGYMGINTRVADYVDRFSNIQGIIGIIGNAYRFTCTSYPNASIVTLQAQIPYAFLACADWMRAAGCEYAVLEGEFCNLFTSRAVSDQELIERVLR